MSDLSHEDLLHQFVDSFMTASGTQVLAISEPIYAEILGRMAAGREAVPVLPAATLARLAKIADDIELWASQRRKAGGFVTGSRGDWNHWPKEIRAIVAALSLAQPLPSETEPQMPECPMCCKPIIEPRKDGPMNREQALTLWNETVAELGLGEWNHETISAPSAEGLKEAIVRFAEKLTGEAI